MATTSIEWTDAVWNPVRGCARVSPGCEHCYAEVMAARFSAPGRWGHGFAERTENGPRWTRRVEAVPEKLAEPLSWRKPRRVFVNSTSDLFHEAVPFGFISAVFGVMAATPQHTYQVLTKRPERMRAFFEHAAKRGEQGAEVFPHDDLGWRIRQWCRVSALRAGADLSADRRQNHGGPWPLPNVWLGVSVEDQRRANERVPHLLRVPAAVRFISMEPLLGPVDLWGCEAEPGDVYDALRGVRLHPSGIERVARVDWVIVGGESGPGARSFDLAWARSLRDQCRKAGVPYFFKQAGARPVANCGRCSGDGIDPVRVGRDPDWCSVCGGGAPNTEPQLVKLRSKKGGDLDEIPADLRVREWPTTAPTGARTADHE